MLENFRANVLKSSSAGFFTWGVLRDHALRSFDLSQSFIIAGSGQKM